MKRVLIITDLFHASPRIPGLCKYLREFGWEPTLLTTPLGEDPESRMGPPNDFAKKFLVIEVPFKSAIQPLKHLLGFRPGSGSRAQLEKKFSGGRWRSMTKKMLIWGAGIAAYPDELRGWRKPAIARGKKLLSEGKFDVVLSSSSPVTSHRIAKTLKRARRAPWIADLRDLWTQNHNYPYPWVRKLFETQLEKRTLGGADALITVSEALAQKLRFRYPAKSVAVAPNGFDPEFVNDPPTPLTEKFTITYTGSIYRGKQDPSKLFEALRDLFDAKLMDRTQTEVRFYGVPQGWLQDVIERCHMSDVAIQYGSIRRSSSFEKQRESQALLAYGWEDPNEIGGFPIKLFEYFAARRPILATGGTPKEQFRAMLDATQAGRHAIGIADIKTILVDYYRDYAKNGAARYHGIPAEMDKYSYREMAKTFAAALNQVAK